MSVQIGLGLFTAQVPPGSKRTFTQEYREILDLVRLAESLHFDSAWVSEHHGSSDGYMPSLLPTLASLAAATDRIRLGTGVILTPFHHPLRLAEDAATVDLISGGRLILGLGLGWREEEFRMFGIPAKERVGRTTDTVEILRRAWTGERFTYEGRYFQYDQVRVTPAPEQEGGIPIYLGGFAPTAVRRAGRLGDGYIRSRGGTLDETRASVRLAEEGAREAGKDPASLGFAQLQNTFVWDEGNAWEVVKETVVHQLGVYGGWGAGGDVPGRDLRYIPPDEQTMRDLTPSGTPAEVAHRLRPLVEAFAGRRQFHLVVRLHYPGMDFETAARAVELFAEQVIPSLKGS
ncbi:MAG TPA: LLM class flavin-dependent oxidoreductase [Actinomycetota bacterium]